MLPFLPEGFVGTIEHPLVLALVILLGSYVLEDAAIVSAALLSADGLLSKELAFVALFLGIFSGDLGLYWLGVLSKKVPWLARKQNLNAVGKTNRWLEKNMTKTVLLVRVIPGLRLPTYLACGYFRLSFIYFLALVLLASIVWTGVIFSGFYLAGTLFWSELSAWKWLLLPVVVLLIFYRHKKSKLSGKLLK